MVFQKGHKLNVGKGNKNFGVEEGRKKGVVNKITKEMRGLVKNILNDNLQDFQRRMNKLNDMDYCNIYVKLLPFVMSKAPRADENKGADKTVIIFKARTERKLENIEEAQIIQSNEANSN